MPESRRGAPQVISTKEWGARPVDTSGLTHKQAVGCILHHTAGGDAANRKYWPEDSQFERDAGSVWMRRNQVDDVVSRGWLDTGYHFLVSRGGLIFEGRHGSLEYARNGIVVYGSHCGVTSYNGTWWGVALEGDFTRALPTPEQMAAGIWLLAQLSIWGGTQATNILGHRDVRPTACPGDLFYPQLQKFRERVREKKLQMQGAA
jgi:N-acetylmuramoyl-L-alanine amidase